VKNIYFLFELWFAVLLTACFFTEDMMTKNIKVTSVYLSNVDSNNEIVLTEDSEKLLNVIVSPQNTTNKALTYTSRNKAIVITKDKTLIFIGTQTYYFSSL
jgi:uncharacterized protein YjdB